MGSYFTEQFVHGVINSPELSPVWHLIQQCLTKPVESKCFKMNAISTLFANWLKVNTIPTTLMDIYDSIKTVEIVGITHVFSLGLIAFDAANRCFKNSIVILNSFPCPHPSGFSSNYQRMKLGMSDDKVDGFDRTLKSSIHGETLVKRTPFSKKKQN